MKEKTQICGVCCGLLRGSVYGKQLLPKIHSIWMDPADGSVALFGSPWYPGCRARPLSCRRFARLSGAPPPPPLHPPPPLSFQESAVVTFALNHSRLKAFYSNLRSDFVKLNRPQFAVSWYHGGSTQSWLIQESRRNPYSSSGECRIKQKNF